MFDMRRREFVALLGAAAAWPFAARAEQPAMPVIGLLNGESPGSTARRLQAFHRGMGEMGYNEGRNVAIEYRWGESRYDRVPALAAELVARPVTAIVAVGGSNTGLAAGAATTSIPIVFITGDDPIKQGLVASLNRPGGNATGVYNFISEMEGKRLGLLRELIAPNRPIGVLLNPAYSVFAVQLSEVQAAAGKLGQAIHVAKASRDEELRPAFAALAEVGAGALLVISEPFFNSRRVQIISLAAQYAVPALYGLREYAVDGGLMSYGTSIVEAYRQVGIYTGRILKGEKPSELPVVEPTKFEFVINLKTAKALGLTVPPTLLAIADEVIE